jgi:hypothetical protein
MAKKDQTTVLRVRLPHGRGLHLSETRQEISAESLRKISPVYPSLPVALRRLPLRLYGCLCLG